MVSFTLSLGEPTKITADNIAGLSMPKLFICAEDDRYERIVGEIQWLYEHAPEPKLVKFYPGTAYGTEFFFTGHKQDFEGMLIGFVEDVEWQL